MLIYFVIFGVRYTTLFTVFTTVSIWQYVVGKIAMGNGNWFPLIYARLFFG